MIEQFHYIFPFGKDNAEVIYDFHIWTSLTDYGHLDADDFYDNQHQLFATVYKNHDPETNVDVFILYIYREHIETLNPSGVPAPEKLTLVFDSVEECMSFLLPYFAQSKESMDFITSYHEDFHGKDNGKD